MHNLLDQAGKVADQAEVFWVTLRETDAVFETNRLKQIQTRETAGSALRLIKGGRIGFSSTTKVNNIEELVTMAMEMAPFGAEARFDFPGTAAYPDIEVFDPAIETMSEETMVSVGQSLIDRVRKHTPELICEAGVSKSILSVNIENSRGGKTSYHRTRFDVGIEGVLVRGTDMLFVGDSESSCGPISDPAKVAENTIEQLQRAARLAQARSGVQPVIFTPYGVASAFIPPLALAFNGKTVLQGASPLGHRRGEAVFHPGLGVIDDPTIRLRPGSRRCDDEAIPSRRTVLVDHGVVGEFLYDLQTAGLAGASTTGSASRGLGSLPNPAPSNIIIERGAVTFAQAVADMKEGLVVEQIIGASQGNILGGEFSGNVLLGYAVERGEIVGRVKDTMISGNVYDVLREINAIGSEPRWVGASLLTPFLYCPRVTISTK